MPLIVCPCFSSWTPFLQQELEREDLDDDERVERVRLFATPSRIARRDESKRNALHIACGHRPSIEIVELLIALYPPCKQELDKTSRYPLHVACGHQASLEVVEYLAKKDPDYIKAQTSFGVSTALHAIG